MIHESNIVLEKYEIKKPDYDYVDREYIGMENDIFPSKRYFFKNGQWYAKEVKAKLFGKKKVRIMFVGDITCFEKQFEEAQQGNEYDFSYELEHVKPIFEKADLVVGNLETMICPNAPYRTEKYVSEQNFHCNAPIEFLDALRKNGFDMLTNANNHDLDTGAVGLGETIDHVEKMGFIHTGTFKTEKKKYEVINIGNFKIAVVAFATEHNNKRCNLTPEGAEFLLNDYSKERAAEVIAKARQEGAELVFTCIHWGKENKLVQNKSQEAIAKELIDLGYDCIIGSHPHVLQPVKIIEANGKKVPVFYSMGNFLSHNVNNQKGRSIIACIDLEKKGKEIELKCSYIPIFTSKSYGSKKYVVLPINAVALDPRNIHKRNLIEKVIGSDIDINKSILFKECVERLETEEEKFKADPVNVENVSVFPVMYDDGKFVYSLYRSSAIIAGMSEKASMSSYSVPSKVGNLPVTGIRVGAIEKNTVIKKINLCLGIQVINEKSFKDCINLEGFQLGRNVSEIRNEAFSGCVNLSAVVMRKKVVKIGNKAFEGCINLRTVKLPANVREIADDAFSGCDKAVFYCEPNSYAEQYAKEHGFSVVTMMLTD